MIAVKIETRTKASGGEQRQKEERTERREEGQKQPLVSDSEDASPCRRYISLLRGVQLTPTLTCCQRC